MAKRNLYFIQTLFTALIIALAIDLNAQQWANLHFDAHCLDYRDLGYPTQNLIPANNYCITALLAHSNGFIYGATSGRDQVYLFFYNRFINKVRPIGRIAREAGVYHGLVEGANGELFIGTGKNMFAHVKLIKEFPVEYEDIEKQLWADIKEHYKNYAGGHIYSYEPAKGDVER
jgi:hypothetical protein